MADYYLECRKHKVAVNITDHKLNPASYPEMLYEFIMQHSECEPVFVPDSKVNIEYVSKFRKDMEIELYISKLFRENLSALDSSMLFGN